ncbi:FAD-dependent oxidoreductase [Aquabacterium sp. J223]|uniref:FAD-dependent oxidoreductase n=1 Tax=Aquabacterium sp. J223 TaxID=2898431 RepID=UPI0021AD5B24|nr:FAD-dependent oxidoreductase [Aquabacterium sp. J223]UUX95116.1 FAD-dependent oxidoreductase [Aquabacterium sp. J223]
MALRNVLIIGGGFSGMAAALALRKNGWDVDLVEIDPGWRSYGAGISLGGATLRAFRQLGILEAFLAEGSAVDGLDIFLPHGQQIGTLPTPRLAGPDVPGGGGIMRPVLARILAQATRDSGTRVRLGCSVESMRQDAQGVDVRFSDGGSGRYDLVVGADGLYSKTRTMLFADAPKPRYSGQAVWRAVLPRPPEVDRPMMWMGPVKPGVNPVSATEMYLFLTENRPQNVKVDPAEFPTLLRALLAPFSAPLVRWIREQIDERSQIVFRPLEALLVPRPWHLGRVVLIGDTVHATTPHLASGACIGLEDALVLAEELGRADGDVMRALPAFQDRRWERCRMVVENSLRLGEIEIANGDKDEHGRIMRDSMMALAQPI